MSEVYPELDATLTYIIIRVLFSTMFVRTYLSLQVRDDGEDRRDQSGHSGRKSGRVSGIESSRGISSSGCGIDGGLEVIKVDQESQGLEQASCEGIHTTGESGNIAGDGTDIRDERTLGNWGSGGITTLVLGHKEVRLN